MGRSCIDLYSNDVGAPFIDVTSFGAYVGGCPTNISVGTRRLGCRSALLTAVGEDKVGDFILHFLQNEGVETRFTPRKPSHRSSAVILGIEPPDRFPLTYYRDNCADVELTIDDILAAPIADSRVLLISGTGLSREPARSATLFAAEIAKQAGTPFDAALVVHSDDAVLIPEGHHPVSNPPGYTTYYLNILAGSAQSLANKEDPAHVWVKETYQGLDARVPIYPVER
jgi:sugar/nucleoside kinase (ribokinase family)